MKLVEKIPSIKHPLYSTWNGMKQRCLNPNNSNYKNYGGRGIKMCDRWKNSFELFVKDIGSRPERYSVDRIDNNGNYEPSNCKWSTAKEQNNNHRIRKLTDEDIIEIKFLYSTKFYFQRELGKIFGVCVARVSNIINSTETL